MRGTPTATQRASRQRVTRVTVAVLSAMVMVTGGLWWGASGGAVAEDQRASAPNESSPVPVSVSTTLVADEDAVARRTAETWLAVPYATVSASQTLDLYLPSSDGIESVPVVVLIHGGAFYGGDSIDVTEHAIALVQQGFAVAAVEYRLTPEAPFPAGAQDVKASVRWLRANAATYGLDSDRFAAWGFSAGGWMATMLGVTGDEATIFDDPSLGNADQSSAVQTVVSWYGLVDFATEDAQAAQVGACVGTTPSHSDMDAFESMWLGEPVTTSPYTELADLTNYIQADSDLPSWYLAHGDADCVVPYGQTLQLTHALTQAGAVVTMRILPGYQHGGEAFLASQDQPTLGFLRAALL